MAFLTMEVLVRHARTRAITRDTLSPANPGRCDRGDASREVGRVVSDVSVLCPRADAERGNSARRTVLGCRVRNSIRSCCAGVFSS